MPVGHFVEVTDEVERGQISPGEKRKVVIDDGTGSHLDVFGRKL